MRAPPEQAFESYLEAKAKMFGHVTGFVVDRVGILWCIRNHPGWPEKDAYYAVDLPAAEAVAAIGTDGSPSGHRLTVLAQPIKEFLSPPFLPGYRRETNPQPFLCGWLEDQADEISRVITVTSDRDLERLNGSDPYIDPREWERGIYRGYFVEIDGVVACRGRCVDASGVLYVTGLDTLSEYRRQGLGHELMKKMQSEAFRRGLRLTTLWSSAMGRSLYHRLGYQEWFRTDVYDFE